MSHEDLVRRIETLERRNRLWWRTAIVAIALAVMMVAYEACSQAQPPAAAQPGAAAQPAPGKAVQVTIDASAMKTSYANFFRATGTPDEVILDFGLYSQVMDGNRVEPVKLNDRVVMNFVTAKKLQATLKTVVTRHEEAFGEIEVDPAKRLKKKGKVD